MQLKAKQILKIQSAWIKITGLSVDEGAGSSNVTTALTSAVAVAGEGGVAVPLVGSTVTSAHGVVVNAPSNRVEIWDNATKQKIASSSGEEFFGRITLSGGVYTLTYYYLDTDGTEKASSFGAPVVIDFDFVYRFRFHELPADAAVSMIVKNVHQDSKGATAVEVNERIAVSGTNTLAVLSSTPSDMTRVKLIVNGKVEDTLGGAPAFSVAGTTITWNAANAGYSLDTSDIVSAMYYI